MSNATRFSGIRKETKSVVETLDIRGLASNTLWMLASQVIAKVSSLLLFVVLARSVSNVAFGNFFFALSFAPLFFVFLSVGLNSAMVREIARDRQRLAVLFASAFVIRVVIGVLALLCTFLGALFFVRGSQAYVTLAIIGIAVCADDLSSQFVSAFRAVERLQYPALVEAINRLLSTALILAVIAVSPRLALISGAYLSGSLGALAFSYVIVRRRFPLVRLWNADRLVVRSLFFGALPIGVAGVLNMGVFRIDAVMLQAFRGPREVAAYGAAYIIFESIVALSWSLCAVTLPRVARVRTPSEAARVVELTGAVVLAIFLPIAVTGWFSADSIVSRIFSERYGKAGAALAVLVVAALFYALAFTARTACVAIGRRREIAIVAALALLVNVGANAVAIPRFGLMGAAWTMLGTEVIEASFLIGLFARSNGSLRMRRELLVPFLATAALLAVLAGFGIRGPMAIAVTLLLYPAALAISTRVVGRGQIRVLLGVVRQPATDPLLPPIEAP